MEEINDKDKLNLDNEMQLEDDQHKPHEHSIQLVE